MLAPSARKSGHVYAVGRGGLHVGIGLPGAAVGHLNSTRAWQVFFVRETYQLRSLVGAGDAVDDDGRGGFATMVEPALGFSTPPVVGALVVGRVVVGFVGEAVDVDGRGGLATTAGSVGPGWLVAGDGVAWSCRWSRAVGVASSCR